jgi:hypothetical protein
MDSHPKVSWGEIYDDIHRLKLRHGKGFDLRGGGQAIQKIEEYLYSGRSDPWAEILKTIAESTGSYWDKLIAVHQLNFPTKWT